VKPMPSLRACGARPSRGRAKVRWPCGESPGMAREAVFSEGCGPRVRGGKAKPDPGIGHNHRRVKARPVA